MSGLARKQGKGIPLARALEVARKLIHRLEPVVDRIEIAGSIRRKKSFVGDIELVLVPKMQIETVGLFEEHAGEFSLLKARLDQMLLDGQVRQRRSRDGRLIAWGEKFQAFVFAGIPVDAFSVVAPAQWGVQMMLRTGPAEYSRAMVTQASKGGLLPDDLSVRGAALWLTEDSATTMIETPEEVDFYVSAGHRYADPEFRWPG